MKVTTCFLHWNPLSREWLRDKMRLVTDPPDLPKPKWKSDKLAAPRISNFLRAQALPPAALLIRAGSNPGCRSYAPERPDGWLASESSRRRPMANFWGRWSWSAAGNP